MNKNLDIKMLDFVPAISGLIGKTALVSSFAIMWANELGIENKNFVLENVRMELLIGSIISLILIIFFKDVSPAGTLSPLVVLIPFMVKLGVHPLILGILVGIFGLIAVKTGLLKKLVNLSGIYTKISVTLAFGVSGIILSLQKLSLYFQDRYLVFILLIVILGIIYALIFKHGKSWIAIPIASVAAFIIPYLFGMPINIEFIETSLNFSPSYWWNDVWQIGYGFNTITILKTIPFAIFIIILWAIDIVSILAVQESSNNNVTINLESSFIAVSLRNIGGVLFGGAQTASMWRSFLIPLFMSGRRMKTSAFILCILGIVFGLTVVPIQIMLYTPLVWNVLLFGIFIPLTLTAIINLIKLKKAKQKVVLVLISCIGISINPILTWILTLLYEKLLKIGE